MNARLPVILVFFSGLICALAAQLLARLEDSVSTAPDADANLALALGVTLLNLFMASLLAAVLLRSFGALHPIKIAALGSCLTFLYQPLAYLPIEPTLSYLLQAVVFGVSYVTADWLLNRCSERRWQKIGIVAMLATAGLALLPLIMMAQRYRALLQP
jgi:hypothetical protein